MKILIFSALLIMTLLILPGLTYAQGLPPPSHPQTGGLSITNKALSETLNQLFEEENPGLAFLNLMLKNAIILIFIIAALAFFFMFIIGGIQWITSGGDKAAIEAARGRIAAALIGLVIVFSVYAILKLIDLLLGVDLTEIDISQLFLE